MIVSLLLEILIRIDERIFWGRAKGLKLPIR